MCKSCIRVQTLDEYGLPSNDLSVQRAPVKVVRSRFSFSEPVSTGNAGFATSAIAQATQNFDHVLTGRIVRTFNGNINDWLRPDSANRGTANVMNSRDMLTKSLADVVFLFSEVLLPSRIACQKLDSIGHAL
jgi:hypothetical protein